VVSADYAADKRSGLREVTCADGTFRIDGGVLQPLQAPAGMGSYLYFQVSDHFAFDSEGDYELTLHRTPTPLGVQFDSWDAAATLAGAYTDCRPAVTKTDGDLVVETWRLEHARFANRQNGGADFRLVLHGQAAIRELSLRRLPR
jgi:hypothetical protein